MQKIKLDIKLTSYDHASVQNAADTICKFIVQNNAKLLAIVKMPVKRKFIYSPRKCHFIYKESREQFTIFRHKIVIFVEFVEAKDSNFFDKMKRVDIQANVLVDIKMNRKEVTKIAA